jgi:diguanylate cyclase (GGDEF)-like protein/PAS domain S-box-containing protein
MTEDAEFYKSLLDNMYDGVYFVDRDRLITYWNHGAEQITGYDSKSVIGHCCSENILNHVTAEGVMLCQNGCPLAASIKDGKSREAEVFLHHAKGNRVPVHVRVAPLNDEKGNIIGAVETFSRNSSSEWALTELADLRSKVDQDELTGLRNRAYTERRLQGLLAEANDGRPTMGVLFADIDNFKVVNDTFGHENGDQVLIMVSRTIRENLRGGDVVGRWGGDEFLIIVYDITSLEQLRGVAEKIRTLIEYSRLDIGDRSCSVTLSIGGTMPVKGDTREFLMVRVDELMYKNKRLTRNRVMVG